MIPVKFEPSIAGKVPVKLPPAGKLVKFAPLTRECKLLYLNYDLLNFYT